MTESIAIFGFTDSLVGQFLFHAQIHERYNLNYFITTTPIPELDLSFEHRSRPNGKTEFVVDGRIFGKQIFYEQDFVERLLADRIEKVFVLVDDNLQRKRIIENLIAADIEVLSFVHQSVVLGGDNDIGKGVVIFPQCYIGYKTDIHDGTILQSNCTIEHHNSVGRFCNLNPSVTTGGFSKIDDYSTVHIGVTLINRIVVGKGCVIGAGSLILRDCDPGFVYYGSPAKRQRKVSD